MIDQNSQFQAILTAVGEAKQANADALGIPWTFAQMAVGDANGTDPLPDRQQTKLINERRRAPLNQLKADPKNPGIIIAEQVIPENIGGFWIREIGLYDPDGDLVAVANCAPTFKPLLTQGSGRTQVIRMSLIVSSLANIVLKVDPSVVLATRQYVDERTYTYVPVQQGGGIKQTASTANKIFLGFSTDGSGRLRATVDTTDLGPFAFTSNLQALLDQILDNVPAELNTLKKLALAVGNDPEYAQNVIRELANKADSATTLEGYSIPIASQPEAEEGAENTKPTTSLRVAQYVTKVLKGFQEKLGFIPVQQGGGVGQTDSDQNKIFIGFGTNSRLKATVDSTDLGNIIFDSNTAQEGASGIIKLATIAEVQQGSETLKAVTPKNLRMGFFIGLGMNGYIVFPTWMGSFMVQWGRYSLPAPTGSQVAVNYPIPFGTVLHAWAGVDGGASDQIGTFGLTATAMTVSKGSADTSPRNGSWFAIGGAF
ncbi:phage tail protein [Pseudomonas sp. 'CRE Jenny 4']|uniref:phage tail protein n=1 Tax=Pseudomonas sp. 'CRE Jenny 4' TaxID=3045817 RepID=UPI0025A23776|nr:phage tail protein [Pseudomonas sp. 'CRE Jenny 4']